MSRIRGKDTKPELKIRRALYSLGYRYRLHDKSLPGKPDMKFTRYRAAIQIHGCFWHGHDCHLFKLPKTREAFWKNKIENNRERDRKNKDRLTGLGWRLLIIWECALKGKYRLDEQVLIELVENWLNDDENMFSTIEGARETG